jgi:pilus assembly protein CpaB
VESRKFLGLGAAVVLALIGLVAIIGYVHGAEQRAQAGEKLVKVLVVKDPVPAGTPANKLGDRVGLEKVSAKVRADGALSSVKPLGNKVAATTLVAGEQLIGDRFIDESNFTATGADVQVPDGMLRTTISLDPERVIGGVLTPGARVAVVGSFDSATNQTGGPITVDGVTVQDGKTIGATTGVLFHKVLVTNVQLTGNVNATDATSGDKTATSSKPGDAPTSQLLVTLAIDNEGMQRLVFAQEFGKVYLSIEPADAPEAGSRTISRNNVYR